MGSGVLMPVRLYRFYNMEKSRYGEPFALCDQCKPRQVVPAVCYLEKIADESVWACINCGARNPEKD